MSYYIVKKCNKKRVVMVLVCVISVLLFISATIFHIVQSNRHDEMYQKTEKQIAKLKENMQLQEKERNREQKERKSELPQYTEVGKTNMYNLYKSDKKIAYLTFDDGPSKTVTPNILDTLKNENVKATFFVLGSRVELYPDVVKREYDEGHFIANHGYSHQYSAIYSSPQAVLDEYNKTNNAIKYAIGIQEYDSHLFRFPGGSNGGKYSNIKIEAIDLLEKNNITHVNWNALTEDSVGNPTKETMMQKLKDTVAEKNSVVILMHDSGNKQKTAEMLPDVITYLKERGYEFKNFYDIMK